MSWPAKYRPRHPPGLERGLQLGGRRVVVLHRVAVAGHLHRLEARDGAQEAPAAPRRGRLVERPAGYTSGEAGPSGSRNTVWRTRGRSAPPCPPGSGSSAGPGRRWPPGRAATRCRCVAHQPGGWRRVVWVTWQSTCGWSGNGAPACARENGRGARVSRLRLDRRRSRWSRAPAARGVPVLKRPSSKPSARSEVGEPARGARRPAGRPPPSWLAHVHQRLEEGAGGDAPPRGHGARCRRAAAPRRRAGPPGSAAPPLRPRRARGPAETRAAPASPAAYASRSHSTRVARTAGPFEAFRVRKWVPARSALRAISPPSASSSRTRWPLAVPPMAGLQLITAARSARSVTASVWSPVRAQASAASQPAWPRPTTITSYAPIAAASTPERCGLRGGASASSAGSRGRDIHFMIWHLLRGPLRRAGRHDLELRRARAPCSPYCPKRDARARRLRRTRGPHRVGPRPAKS